MSSDMKQMRKNFSNEKFSQAVAFEAANRAMNRKVLEFLRNIAAGEPAAEKKVKKEKKVVEPVEGEIKPKKAPRAKKAAADAPETPAE